MEIDNYRFLKLLLVLILILGCSASRKTGIGINGKVFYVEIAKTPEQREKGLMHRKNLKENEGMFFIFEEEDKYWFWMKNTFIPLDIIWISAGRKVVDVSKNNQPQNLNPITPSVKAKYVLEINAGLAEKFGIKPGDEVVFNAPDPLLSYESKKGSGTKSP